MNKKHLILLALPALMLSGCTKEISGEEAKAKAKEIADHEVKTEDYKALSANVKMVNSVEGKVEGEQVKQSEEMNIVMEFAVEQSYIHTYSYTKETDGDKVEENLMETWAYIKDDAFYSVTKAKEAGKEESKTYVKVSGADAIKVAYDGILDSTVKTVLTTAANKETISNVQNYADGKAEEGVQYDFKFYTAGEGNLTAEATAKFTDYIFDGIKTNGTGKVKFGWDKYLMVEEAVTSELHGVDTESDTDATAKIEVNEKLAFEVKAAYPNLDEYKQVVLG